MGADKTVIREMWVCRVFVRIVGEGIGMGYDMWIGGRRGIVAIVVKPASVASCELQFNFNLSPRPAARLCQGPPSATAQGSHKS